MKEYILYFINAEYGVFGKKTEYCLNVQANYFFFITYFLWQNYNRPAGFELSTLSRKANPSPTTLNE